MPLSQKEKPFSEFFVGFLKCPWKFEHFEKKDDPHRICFSEVTDFENVDTHNSKKSRFRGACNKQYGKHAQALLKPSSKHRYHIHWSRTRKLSWKKSLLLTWEILGMLVNTLAVDEMYPLLNRVNLTIPIQMQLSQKQKTFSQFFAAFLKCRLKFKYFEKKDHPHRFCLSEITDSENVVRYITKKSCFRGPFNKQSGKGVQGLLKSGSKHPYQTN